jgi:hypothetical protein
MDGCATSGRDSRAAFTARMMDSVPPLVKMPGVSAEPPSRAATAPTTWRSSATMLGKAVGSRPLTSSISMYAVLAASRTRVLPLSYT